MPTENKIVVRERVYIPIETIDMEAVKTHYARRMYDQAACRKCEYKEDRHSYHCDNCEAYLGRVKLYNTKDVNGQMYVGLPTGDKAKMQEKIGFAFSDFKIVDRRTNAEFHYDIKLTIKLRDNQERAVRDFLKKKYGLLEAPPRTGKTLMSLAIGLALGQRFVVLANQHEFLEQFLDHIHGNEREGIPKCTNLPEIEKKAGKKLYGFPKKDEDFENFQIFVMTYQQYLSEKSGRDRFKKIVKNVGTLLVDECFTHDHTVTTKIGQVKIGDIVEGRVPVDEILSFNHRTQQAEFRKIESHTKKVTKKLCEVVIDGVTYRCTPDHEFFVENVGYVKACQLQPGQKVVTT